MAKHLTTEIFIEKAKAVHGNRYNYSQVLYVNAHTKIKILCEQHGEFLQRPNDHLSGCACPECGQQTIINKLKKSTKQFIAEATIIHQDKYDYSKCNYINANTKVCIICPKHGEFWQTPHGHLSGKGCSKCSGKFKKTTEQFIREAQAKHGNKYNYSKTRYVNDKTKVEQ